MRHLQTLFGSIFPRSQAIISDENMRLRSRYPIRCTGEGGGVVDGVGVNSERCLKWGVVGVIKDSLQNN